MQWISLPAHKIFTERKYITTLHTRRDLKKDAAAPYRTFPVKGFRVSLGFVVVALRVGKQIESAAKSNSAECLRLARLELIAPQT